MFSWDMARIITQPLTIEQLRSDMMVNLIVAPRYWYKELAKTRGHHESVRKELIAHLTHGYERYEIMATYENNWHSASAHGHWSPK